MKRKDLMTRRAMIDGSAVSADTEHSQYVTHCWSAMLPSCRNASREGQCAQLSRDGSRGQMSVKMSQGRVVNKIRPSRSEFQQQIWPRNELQKTVRRFDDILKPHTYWIFFHTLQNGLLTVVVSYLLFTTQLVHGSNLIADTCAKPRR